MLAFVVGMLMSIRLDMHISRWAKHVQLGQGEGSLRDKDDEPDLLLLLSYMLGLMC